MKHIQLAWPGNAGNSLVPGDLRNVGDFLASLTSTTERMEILVLVYSWKNDVLYSEDFGGSGGFFPPAEVGSTFSQSRANVRRFTRNRAGSPHGTDASVGGGPETAALKRAGCVDAAERGRQETPESDGGPDEMRNNLRTFRTGGIIAGSQSNTGGPALTYLPETTRMAGRGGK